MITGYDSQWPRGLVANFITAEPSSRPPRPLSLVTMSVTLMAASCDSIGSCSLDVDAESLADSTQVESSINRHNAGSNGCCVLRIVLECI